MKAKLFLLYGIAFMVVIIFLLPGCDVKQRPPSDRIPVNEENAARHVIPIDSVRAYINSFATGRKELAAQVQDTSFFNGRFNMPVAELFNRDAIAALLNAPGAAGVRIYLGRKANGEVVFVLLPINKEGKDIKVKLLNYAASKGATNEAAGAGEPDVNNRDAQGMENGQRCPSICDENL